MGGGHDFPSCENCQQCKSSVELRHSDQQLCDECYEIQEYGMGLSEDTQTEAVNHEIESQNYDGHVDHTPKDDEDDQNVNAAMIDLLDDNDQDKDSTNGLIERKTGEEKCVKCRKKVLNGIRCSSCKKALHCKCGGLSKEDMKTTPVKEAVKENKLMCYCCNPSVKDFPKYLNLKNKEILDLKKCIGGIERNFADLCNEMKVCSERCTGLEDRLPKEKN